ncbi:MAG TPA: M36 family metallopeptidase, partial [Ferruginibacter sp.]|nr:M36 family metallopeptidase [Ferruginibacter sp.]
MRKILLSLVFLSSFLFLKAQNSSQADEALAKQLVQANAKAIGMTDYDLSNFIVNYSYFNQAGNEQLVYLVQGYKGLPVFNQMMVLSFRDGKLLSKAGGFLPNMDQLTSGRSAIPSVSASNAVRSALTESRLIAPASISQRYTINGGKKLDFGNLGLSKESVTAELMWVPVFDGTNAITSVKLGWQVEVSPLISSDYWLVRVDASNSSIVNKSNLTVFDSWDKSGDHLSDDNFLLKDPSKWAKNPFESKSSLDHIFSITDNGKTQTNNPSLVTTVNYTVIKYPAEAPSFPGGAAAIHTNPWTMAGGLATTYGWHNDGVLDYTVSRGNNVHAHEDQAATNSNAGIQAQSTTTPDPLNFTYAGQPNYTVQPTTAGFQQFAITNLFYWNNIIHDATYKYGFNEVARNFQNNNQLLGGLGLDYVQADAQDGSGTNNANFATPADGTRPRMQMYLFNPAPGQLTFVVNSPASIAGPYTAVEGNMSPNNLLGNVGPRTANLVYYNDQAAATHDACVAPSNAAALNGKIALINRGNCNFTVKVLNAQAAGAIGVVMVNNVPGPPIIMGGGPDPTIVTPAIMISDVDGATIAAQLNNPAVNVTMSSTAPGTVNLDGDIDNGVVAHEYFHGVSNRCTGNGFSCLGNAEEGGEGWSDYNGLMLTTDWSTAVATDGFNKKRPMG